ncbi:MAG TPA: sigma factor-like helix-turn-helix DNA-binding protein [Tepidisphaeraceae bacterium]|jgi:transcriptional regulator|nr:sigma factor-like helix-turn-helix DNA-binding protein [Tepidisphaeraceae bacterium]
MQTISLKDLTEKQKEAWRMRYRYGWRMKRIAIELGTTEPAVSQLLRRAQRRAGLPATSNVRVLRTQPRLAAMQSLSSVFDC